MSLPRDWSKQMKVPDLRQRKRNTWCVDRAVMKKAQADHSRVMSMFTFSGGGGRHVPAGTYTRLRVLGGLGLKNEWCTMMSDTPDEILDQHDFVLALGETPVVHNAILIHGLGLGCTVKAAVLWGQGRKVQVVEKSKDVLWLVGGHWKNFAKSHGVELELIHDNCLLREWPKGAKWDIVWHDIWISISLEHVPEISKLNRRFGRRTQWQGYWAQGHIERMKREDRVQSIW